MAQCGVVLMRDAGPCVPVDVGRKRELVVSTSSIVVHSPRPTPAGRFETAPYAGYGALSRDPATAKCVGTMRKTVGDLTSLGVSRDPRL